MHTKKKSNNTYYIKSSKRKTNFNRIVVQKVKHKVQDLFNFKLFEYSQTGGINEICNR